MIKQQDIDKLYKKFGFIERDISKFKEIASFNNAKELIDAEENICKYIANKISKDGLIKIFEDATKTNYVKDTFDLINLIIETNNIDIIDEDIEKLSNKKEYEKFYNKIIKKIDLDDIDNLNIANELLKRIIELKLSSLETYDLENIDLGNEPYFSDNILKDYLIEISKFKVLTKEEEQDLFRKYKNGDEEAKELLINHNLKLVVAVAKKHKPPTLRMPFIDYIGYGNLGLIEAVDRFDSDRGTKFSTCAVWWIRQSLVRNVANNDTTIRIPVHMFELIKKTAIKQKKFIDQNNRPPTDEELRQILKITKDQYKKMKDARQLLDLTSLDMKIDSDDKESRQKTIANFISDSNEESVEDKVERQILHDQEEKIMREVLTEKEMKVLKLRLGFDTGKELTLEAVGKIFGVTRERIRQIEAKAYAKLRFYGSQLKKAEKMSLKELKQRKELDKEISKRKVYENMKKKTIYELVNGEKEEVDKIIEKLSEYDKELIKRRENENLDAESHKRFYTLVRKIKKVMNEDNKKPRKKSIYEFFEEDRDTVYNVIINELSKEEQDLIHKREMAVKDKIKLTPDENKKFYPLVTKIKNKINKKRKQEKPIINKPEDEGQTNYVLNNYNDKLKRGLEISQEKPKQETNNFENNYKTLLSIAMKDPRIMKRIDIIDLSITCVRYGIGKSEKPRDIDTIAKFYGITTEAVEEISTRVLKELYDVLVDGIIDSNAKQYVKIANQNNKEE